MNIHHYDDVDDMMVTMTLTLMMMMLMVTLMMMKLMVTEDVMISDCDDSLECQGDTVVTVIQ